MDYPNLCLGCMEEKGASQTCPHCGYEEGAAPKSALHLPPGTVLQDKYLLGRVLGQGGFGITYLAWDMTLDLKLAIKEYFPLGIASRSSGQPSMEMPTGELKEHYSFGLERYLKEAKTLARFSEHPNIVTVRDFFEANNTAYIVMNYIDGRTMEEYLKSAGGKITYSHALKVMMPVLDALKEMHREGILHRDISPDNIFIGNDGRVILIDFGAARQEMREKSKSFSVILKAGYAPEEQYRSRGSQGPWTDIYAAGGTLYRCITGEIPPEAVDRLIEETLIPPSHFGIEISETSENALLKALAVKANDRYQTVREFQEGLIGTTAFDSTVVPDVFISRNTESAGSNDIRIIDVPKQSGSISYGKFKKNNRYIVLASIMMLAGLMYLALFPPGTLDKQDESVLESIVGNEIELQVDSKLRGNSVGNIINKGLVASEGDWIYYSNIMDNGKLYRKKSGSNENIMVIDESAWSINLVDGWIYYSNSDFGNRIYKIRTDGTERIRLNDDYSSNINVVGSWIYYRNWDDGESIYKIRTDGSGRAKLNHDSSWHINVVDSSIYYRNADDKNRIYKININGSERKKINDDSSWFVNVVGNWIYYCNEDDGWKIYRIKIDGSNKEKLNNSHSGFLNADESWIYYCNHDDASKIYKLNLIGYDYYAINSDTSSCLNVVDGWIYYLNHDDNDRMYRIRFDGSERYIVN